MAAMNATTRSIAVFALLLASVAALAADSRGLVLRGERDLGGFHAQQALVFEKGRVVFSRNSNFLCEPSTQVVLGVLEAPYDDRLQSRRKLLEQVAARLPEGAAAGQASPHDLRLYLNRSEVTADKPNDATVEQLLESFCERKGLKPERAVRVELDDAEKPKWLRVSHLAVSGKGRTELVAVASACRHKGTGGWECDVAGFGKAFLAGKSE